MIEYVRPTKYIAKRRKVLRFFDGTYINNETQGFAFL
jgi:hypothetical protein